MFIIYENKFYKTIIRGGKRYEEEKGITLVALVVTIVVLLILAGVSINLVLGDNGIIAKAQEAKTKQAEASENDLKGMNGLVSEMEGALAGNGGAGGSGTGTKVPAEATAETAPYFPDNTFTKKEGTIDTGLVIQDASGNEYVWVVVPRTTAVYATTGLGKTTFTDADYTSIENDLKEYTKTYRGSTSYSDVYYPDDKNVGWFADATVYNNLKNSMLKSVYENGGFYVGRYEAGIGTNRTSIEAQVNGKYPVPTTAPVTKADAYPYTYVTRTQAQNLASNVNSGTKTSSLMFGVQWDLILAFMHTKGNVSNNEINENSVNLGNYRDNIWNITNKNAKYSVEDGNNYINCPYEKKQAENILLTTGSSEKFAHMNIYDIAGNVWEYTLENTGEANRPCSLMGSYYKYNGSVTVSTRQYLVATNYNFYDLGFRIVIY